MTARQGDVTVALSPVVSYEFLDDGGLLAARVDTDELWQLSAPASRLWQEIRAGGPVEALRSRIAAQFGISVAEASAVLTAFCDEMSARGIVTVSGAGEAG